MSDVIAISGTEALLQTLGLNLDDALQDIAFAVSEEGRERLADYPDVPTPADPDRWYERGQGPHWRRVDGSIARRDTSEDLGASWTVQRRPYGALLQNTASYAAVVQNEDDQSAQHEGTGWVTDQDLRAQLEADGTLDRLATQRIEQELR